MPSPAAKKSPAHRPQRHGLLPVPGPLRYPFVHLGGGRQARVKGIADIFQGNGGKRLQTLVSLSGFSRIRPMLPSPPADATRVNLASTVKVNYWCQTLNCTETRLRNAVLAVGPLATDVQTYLQR